MSCAAAAPPAAGLLDDDQDSFQSVRSISATTTTTGPNGLVISASRFELLPGSTQEEEFLLRTFDGWDGQDDPVGPYFIWAGNMSSDLLSIIKLPLQVFKAYLFPCLGVSVTNIFLIVIYGYTADHTPFVKWPSWLRTLHIIIVSLENGPIIYSWIPIISSYAFPWAQKRTSSYVWKVTMLVSIAPMAYYPMLTYLGMYDQYLQGNNLHLPMNVLFILTTVGYCVWACSQSAHLGIVVSVSFLPAFFVFHFFDFKDPSLVSSCVQ